MKTSELLARLRSLDVKVWVQGGELKVSAPRGALTPDLREELARSKADLRAVLSRAEEAPPAPIQRTGRDGPLALSFTQQRLWFLDQLTPGLLTYNMWISLRLRGPLDFEALRRSLGELVRRHEILRTTYPDVDGVPRQVVDPGPGPELELVEPGADLSEGARRAHVDALLRAWLAEPFDLARGPLLRPRLVRLLPEEHVLFVVVHHIAFDGLSKALFMRELTAAYEAALRGAPAPFEELPLQYADYAAWQRDLLAGETGERQLSYWRQVLGGELPVLELPTDRPRPPVQTHRGGLVWRTYERALVDRLAEIAGAEGATLFAGMLAVVLVLLRKLTGQEDLCVGTAVANRERRELESLLGYFVNTLVLRNDLTGDPTFVELVRRVRDVSLGALEHQDTPFERIVDDLVPERSLGISPLFQTFFVLDEDTGETRRFGAAEFTQYDLQLPVARTDLVFAGLRDRDCFILTLEYNADLFDEATIAGLHERFGVLLREVLEGPERPISELSVLTAGEEERLLERWNDTGPGAPAALVQRLFEAQVERTPDAPAVATLAADATRGAREVERWSYRELDRRANRVARLLIAQGVRPGDLVGLSVDRTSAMVAAQLGILKAGAAYVPLDPALPRERLRSMVADARLALVLTERAHAPLFAEATARLLSLDEAAEALARAGDARPELELDPSARMYVIYTSGSTGRPKGVELEHRSVASFLAAMAAQPGLQAGERLLALTTLSFDISVLEVFLPLVVGAEVLVAPKEVAADGERLARALESLRPDVVQATPATWRMLLLAGWSGDPGLRVVCGGEALPRELADQLLARAGAVWNVYGPTETTVWSTVHRVGAGAGAVPIGRPIAGTRAYVLDERRRPAPVGVAGELFLGGAGVARGYLGREDLTRERFLPDPFEAEGSAAGNGASAAAAARARMYRTGDRARWLPSGELEYLGRLDDQVKLRGHRIELGEIEAVLAGAAGVAQCAVVLRTDARGEGWLAAFVVPEAGSVLDAAALLQRAREQLPAYMLPGRVVTLAALPLTPSAKVDRRALRALALEAPSSGAEHVEPRTELERRVAAIWSEVLGVERVGLRDDFFQLGGNSLLTTQVMARLRSACGVDVPLIGMFEEPTVAGLARRVAAATPSEVPAISPVPRDAPLPLSFTQQRLWFLDRLEPGLSAYNILWGWAMRGPLDVAVLERALSEIVRRHEILRTSFPEVDGSPRQRVDPPAPVRLEVVERPAHVAAEAWASEVRRLVDARAQQPFDLARGPLFAPYLVRLAADEHWFMVHAHHAVFDGWSGLVFRRELVQLYEAGAAGRPAPLAELPFQFGDYAAWQRDLLAGAGLASQLDYWRATLAGPLPLLELPLDRPRPPVVTYRGENVERTVESGLVARLVELGAGAGATRFMALLAAYKVFLQRIAGVADVIVGTPVANRSRPELEGLIGFFANTLPLRTDLSGDPTFRQVLGRVRESVLGALDHQDVPFERIVEEVQPERHPSYTPLFQTLFVLEDVGDGRPRRGDDAGGMGDVRFASIELGTRVARTDFTLWAAQSEQGERGFLFWAEYNTDLFERATAERLLACFETLLRAAVERPDVPISRLALVSAEERRQLLQDRNATRSTYPRDGTLAEAFAAEVRRRPDAIAAVFAAAEPGGASSTVTYAELDRAANRLAHHLLGLGVERGELVGLCTERSLPMLVGILGILKAGGAYLPLDPGYPRERLAFMLEDSRLRVLLVQRRLRDALPPFAGELAVLDDEPAPWAAAPDTAPAPRSGPRDLAYAMFTSGSTGRPKGVCVEQRSVLRLVMDPNFAALGPDEVLLHFAPISFDASTLEVWGALLRGGRMVVYPPTAPSLEELGRVIREHGVTTAWLTAGLFSLMVDERLEDLRGLRQLLAGGDVLPVAQVSRFLNEVPGCRLINGYGPTENTTFTCCHTIAAPVAGAVPIGRPISDTHVVVVDQNLELVPAGVVGELLVGGDGLARGYLERPELTAERFVPDPFRRGERLYRTGDRVRWRHDGALEFLGRRDDQVKIRGFRIELGEVEAVLGEHPGVRECVALVREDKPGDKRLVAYLVASGERAPEAPVLRAYMEKRVPGYMVPSAYVAMAALPLSPNGKVARRALPAPELSDLALGNAYAAPRNEVERELCAIWHEVLGVERVGVHDNFFELGGNSLLSTRAMSRLEKAFDVQLPLRELFLEPTVAGLAARIHAGGRDDVSARAYESVFDRCLVPLQPRGWRTPLFLVSGAHAHEDDFLRFVGTILPHMGMDQPIYGFKARGLDGRTEPHAGAEQMAADYVAEMRAFRPQGPYLLAGNCVGGIVAFEMAQQLVRAGAEVAMVALLDTTRPRADYEAYVDHYYRFWKVERFRRHFAALRALGLRGQLGYLRGKLAKKLQRYVPLPLSEEERQRTHIERVERQYSQILARYRPARYPGRIVLILNEEFHRSMPDAGWGDCADEVETHVVPGDHVTRLSLNALRNAELLRAAIDRAAGAARPRAPKA